MTETTFTKSYNFARGGTILINTPALIVWRNFSILSPKLVLAYAENILSDSRLKNCAKSKSGWCKSVGVERFEIWIKKDFFGKKSTFSMLDRECRIVFAV